MRIIGYDVGVACVDCLALNFTNINIQLADIGLTATILSYSEPTAFSFTNCVLAGCESLGFIIIGGGPVRITGGVFESVGSMSGGTQGVAGAIYYRNTAFLPTGLVIDGCYFENNRGSADIYIDNQTGTASRVVDSITNCMFARNSNVNYTLNNIFVKNDSSTSVNTVVTIGNGFKGYPSYVASASRLYIDTGGTNASNSTIYTLGNFYNDATEIPTAVANVSTFNNTLTANISGAGYSIANISTLTVGNIVNNNANGVGNIGNATGYYNTVFAQATSAQYADLAENYLADCDYVPGTVVSFGGSAEVTVTTSDADPLVAGVVSTNPAHLMNSALTGDHVVPLALIGRVLCQVQGPVTPGAMMISAGNGRARAEPNPTMGTVIGKAVQAFDGDLGTIEIVVGRL